MKSKPRRPRWLAVLIALPAVVVVAFLVLGSGGSGPSGPIAQAASISSAAAGFRMHMAMVLGSSSLANPVTATGDGIIDLRDHAAAVTMKMDLGNLPAVTQQLGGSTLRMDMIMKGTSMYMKMPSAFTSALGAGGRSWILVDLSKISSVPGLKSFGGSQAWGDPSRVLRDLSSISDGVVNQGPEPVDGVQTTHYRAQVSVSRLGSELSAISPSSGQAAAVLQQAVPSGQLPVDVWIDAHHLVRRVRMSLDLASPGGQSLQEAITMDFSDYGNQPDPPAPPSEDVTSLSAG